MGISETLASDQAFAAELRGRLTADRVGELLCGCVEVESQGGGWLRPRRLSGFQTKALCSCLASRPGLFRQMAVATSGVCLRFATDADEIAISVRLDAEPQGTTSVLAPLDRGRRRAHDGFGVVVDGRRVPCDTTRELARPWPWLAGSRGMRLVSCSLREDDAETAGFMTIPGLGKRRCVTVWLPCLRGCSVRDLWTDGTYVEPLPPRERLLVIGDSIGQGFCCDDPAGSWAALLADELDLELLNQSVGGQVFQPSSLPGNEVGDIARIIVQLGLNYRWETLPASRIEQDAHACVRELARRFGDVPICLLTPTWYDEVASPSRNQAGAHVDRLLRSAVEGLPTVSVVDGLRLVDHDASLFVDGEHPGPRGHEQFATRLASCISGISGQVSLSHRALDLLEDAPLRAQPLANAIRMGRAEACVAERGCVLGRFEDGHQMLYAPDHVRALDLAAPYVRDGMLTLLEPHLSQALSRATGHLRVVPVHVCVYQSARPVAMAEDRQRCIKTLGPEHADVILDWYSHAEYVERTSLVRRLAEGRFFGAFVDEELVGFVGEHEEGSIGMLEVRRRWRRSGWGEALEAAKINDCLARGELPWCEVYPQNKNSLTLQRKLGLTVLPSSETCYLSRRETLVSSETGGAR